MKGSYNCINGTIASNWELKGNKLNLTISIPVNPKTKVYIHNSEASKIKEGNKALSRISDIKVLSSKRQQIFKHLL